MRLTIGMATYDDFNGVYFTLQALKIYHALEEINGGCEILVIDSHPQGCAATRKAVHDAGGVYQHRPDCPGTAAPRDRLFREAKGEIVLCVDCHVLLHPNALNRVLRFFADPTNDKNMLQGVLVYDDGHNFATHMKPTWGAHMLGQWADNSNQRECGGVFEIQMHGLGLFAMRKTAWVGFNPRFRGFGGEEGYVHEKVRRAGGKVFCDANLRWTHRFKPDHFRPPYPSTLDDRCFNYLVGHRELGLDPTPLLEQFEKVLAPGRYASLTCEAWAEPTLGQPERLPSPASLMAKAPPAVLPRLKPKGAWPKAQPMAEKPKVPPPGNYQASVNVNRTINGDQTVQVRAELTVAGPAAPCAFDLADVMVSPDGTKLSVGLKEVE